MPHRPVVLFDLDGTLIDSERVAMDVTHRYFLDRGHSPTPEHLQILVGRAWEPALEWMLERYPLGKPTKAVTEEVLGVYRQALFAGVPEIPGSFRLVRDLFGEFRLGLVSGTHREDIFTVLNALNLTTFFDTVVGYGDYTESKPSPVPYLQALERLNVANQSVLVFEDSSAGITAAKAAGLEVVAVGNPPEHDSTRPTTSWSVPDFQQVTKDWVRTRARPRRT